MKKQLYLILAASFVLISSNKTANAEWKALAVLGATWVGINAAATYVHYKHAEKRTAFQLGFREPISELIGDGLVISTLGALTQAFALPTLVGFIAAGKGLLEPSKPTTISAALSQIGFYGTICSMLAYQLVGQPIAAGLARTRGKGKTGFLNKEFAMGAGIPLIFNIGQTYNALSKS